MPVMKVWDGGAWVDVLSEVPDPPPPASILAALVTVDGAGTGLDADLLDGQQGAYYTARANHTGTQSADTVVDGTTNHVFTAADDTKLTGIATAATANSTDAALLARANHTGTQLHSTISDFDAAVTALVPTGSQPLDSDLTAIAALTTTPYGRAFLALADATAARTALALGTAATTAATAYDAAGAASTAQAAAVQRANHTGTQLAATVSDFNAAADARVVAGITGKQPLDADLTAIAALGTGAWSLATISPFAQTLVDDVDAPAARTTLGLGTAAISASTAFDAAGAATAAQAAAVQRANHTGTQLAATVSDFTAAADARVVAGITGKQPLDTELTALAGLVSAADRLPYFTGVGTAALATFTAYARTLLDDIDAAAARATLGLGTAATTASTAYEAAGAVAAASTADRARANHTGTQLAATISNFAAAVDTQVTTGTGWSTAPVSIFAKTLLDDADAATMLTTLGISGIDSTSHALGIMAMGTVIDGVSVPTSGEIVASGAIAFTPLVGRRYRCCYVVRAFTVFFNTNSAFHFMVREGGLGGVALVGADDYASASTNYGGYTFQRVFIGDGVFHNFVMCVESNQGNGGTVYGSAFYIEDVGPVR